MHRHEVVSRRAKNIQFLMTYFNVVYGVEMMIADVIDAAMMFEDDLNKAEVYLKTVYDLL